MQQPDHVPKASQIPSFTPKTQTRLHSPNRTPSANPCQIKIFRCQIPFPKTQPQTYCRACSVRKIFFSVQKSAFYACKNRVIIRDKVNGISPHKKHHHRGRLIWTETSCKPASASGGPATHSQSQKRVASAALFPKIKPSDHFTLTYFPLM